MITQNYLKQVLDYNPDTGIFIRRISKGAAKKGSFAGSPNSDGYLQIEIDGSKYRAHRLAWLYMYGSWPLNEIDHIDGNPANNRILNLREATHLENVRNRGFHRNNTSGMRGVSWKKKECKWVAQISIGGKRKHIGYFNDLDSAAAAYQNEAKKYFGEFIRTTISTPQHRTQTIS